MESFNAILNKRAMVELEDFLSENREMSFPKYDLPIISVLLVTFNKAEYTYRCLKSILAFADVPYEIVIIDNASSDNTQLMLENVKGATILLNEENLHYAKGNNQGAGLAKAPYVLLLNNDTEIISNTFSSLVKTIQDDENCAAVGAKLVWPNGMLQEAGSIIWRDASCLGYGRGDDPKREEYNFVREVDYCSGAGLLVKKEIFSLVGGLDDFFYPAYYEDTDLCMKIKNEGYKIKYSPRSLIYHFEYSSSSKERALELMKINQVKFFNKWRNVLSEKHISPDEQNQVLLGRNNSGRKNLIMIDDKVPKQSDGSGFGRSLEILQTLTKQYNVTFFPKQFIGSDNDHIRFLQSLGIEILCSDINIDKILKERSNFYDIAFISRPHNFAQTYESFKLISPRTKVIYDAEALFYGRDYIKNQVLGRPSLEDCERSKGEELALISKADFVTVVSKIEKRNIAKELSHLEDKIGIYGCALEVSATEKKFNERRDLFFLGAFGSDDTPNVDAVKYFVEEIFPLVRQKLGCKLIIAGSNPTDYIKSLAAEHILFKGFIEIPRELFNSCRLFIVPHRYAGGIPIKLSESLANGIPAVVSRLIANQVELGCETLGIGDDAESFAAEVVDLYNDEKRWNCLRVNGIKYIEKTHSPHILHSELISIIENVLS